MSVTSHRSSSSILGFTPDQHKALLNLLQNMKKSHSINQITSMPGTNSAVGPSDNDNSGNVICNISHNPKDENWILDTGATNHICHSLSKFHSYKRVSPTLVKLPNGSNIMTQIFGTIYFSENLYLNDVLYIPIFNCVTVNQFLEL